MGIIDATALTADKVDVFVGLAYVEHFGALVSVEREKFLLEMINCTN